MLLVVPVGPLYPRDAYLVALIPARTCKVLGGEVLRIVVPVTDGLLIGVVDDRQLLTVACGRRLPPEISRLMLGKIYDVRQRLCVTVGVLGSTCDLQDGYMVRRLWPAPSR